MNILKIWFWGKGDEPGHWLKPEMPFVKREISGRGEVGLRGNGGKKQETKERRRRKRRRENIHLALKTGTQGGVVLCCSGWS